MQQRSFPTPVASPTPSRSSAQTVAYASQSGTQAARGVKTDCARVFNTALVSSLAESKRDLSAELQELTQSAAFQAILNSVRQLAAVQGISERQSSEQIIQTFRKMDEVWGEYLAKEGLDKIRKQR
ncbi:MAG: hypothetical protein ACO3A2_02880 [Bdellovibrionia bacterium]